LRGSLLVQSRSACSEGESDDTDGNGSKGCKEAGGGALSFGSDADLHLFAGGFLDAFAGLVVGTDNTRVELALLQRRGYCRIMSFSESACCDRA